MAPIDALHPPPSVVATWPFNYTNPPETRGWGIVVLLILLIISAYIVVSLRIWARFRLSKNPGVDDALIMFNMIPLTALTVSLCLGFKVYGFDRHVWNSPLPTLLKARHIVMVIEGLYLISTSATKISILLFYRRLARGTISKGFIFAVHAAIASVVIYFLYFFISLIMTCQPFEAYWMQLSPVWYAKHKGKFHCQGEAVNLITSAVVSVIHDFIACGLPMILLWKLRISKSQKIALGGLFSVGIFLCICGVLRLAAMPKLYFGTYDTTWDSWQVLIWLAVEAHMAVICASAPALKVFFKKNSATSGYSSWPSNGYLGRSGSSSSTKKFLEEKRSVPVVTDEKLLGSYFNTTGGDQGDRVWFQSINPMDVNTVEKSVPKPQKSVPRRDKSPIRTDKSLPKPPRYEDSGVYLGADVYKYEVRAYGPNHAF